MRKAICCFFLTCAAAFAQSTPDNAAADALKKRLLSMNLLNPPARKPVLLAGTVAAPSKVCAIPLLRVIPPGTSDKMGTFKPNVSARGDTIQVPAPACGEALFTNK
jgi:hypothetical protein